MGSRFEGRDSLADASQLNVVKILERIHIETGQRRLGEHVRIGADAVYSQALAFEVLNAGDFLFANDGAGHAILSLPDDDQILSAAGDRSYRSKAADNSDIDVA
jgi:hypothetical protein